MPVHRDHHRDEHDRVVDQVQLQPGNHELGKTHGHRRAEKVLSDDHLSLKQRMLDVLHEELLLPEDYTRNSADVPELDGILHNAVIGFLARAPSALLLLNQEDLTKETEQQNLPGSTSQYPNWRRKMRFAVDELRQPGISRDFTAMFRNQLVRTGRAS